ncbi:MAG: hypothetical protein ACRDK9_11460 [Solirubrobacterales bacterium]
MRERPGTAVLEALAEELRAERSVISAHVVEPADEVSALGSLAAAGPRAASAPGEYAFVVEAMREGYLLHYATPRLLSGADADLALLAGDYLYALGLERLAALEDLAAVRELADLISLAAQAHGGDRAPDRARREGESLWLASAVAVGCGSSDAHAQAKGSLREASPPAAGELWSAALATAREAALEGALTEAANALDFRPDPLS